MQAISEPRCFLRGPGEEQSWRNCRDFAFSDRPYRSLALPETRAIIIPLALSLSPSLALPPSPLPLSPSPRHSVPPPCPRCHPQLASLAASSTQEPWSGSARRRFRWEATSPPSVPCGDGRAPSTRELGTPPLRRAILPRRALTPCPSPLSQPFLLPRLPAAQVPQPGSGALGRPRWRHAAARGPAQVGRHVDRTSLPLPLSTPGSRRAALSCPPASLPLSNDPLTLTAAPPSLPLWLAQMETANQHSDAIRSGLVDLVAGKSQ